MSKYKCFQNKVYRSCSTHLISLLYFFYTKSYSRSTWMTTNPFVFDRVILKSNSTLPTYAPCCDLYQTLWERPSPRFSVDKPGLSMTNIYHGNQRWNIEQLHKTTWCKIFTWFDLLETYIHGRTQPIFRYRWTRVYKDYKRNWYKCFHTLSHFLSNLIFAGNSFDLLICWSHEIVVSTGSFLFIHPVYMKQLRVQLLGSCRFFNQYFHLPFCLVWVFPPIHIKSWMISSSETLSPASNLLVWISPKHLHVICNLKR